MNARKHDPAQGLNAAVAAVLEGERAAAGWTLEQLAEHSGVSYRTLQRLLRSRDRHIDLEVLDALAAAYNLLPEQIVAAAQERMSRADPDVYDAIRHNPRLGAALSKSKGAGTDQPTRTVRRPS